MCSGMEASFLFVQTFILMHFWGSFCYLNYLPLILNCCLQSSVSWRETAHQHKDDTKSLRCFTEAVQTEMNSVAFWHGYQDCMELGSGVIRKRRLSGVCYGVRLHGSSSGANEGNGCPTPPIPSITHTEGTLPPPSCHPGTVLRQDLGKMAVVFQSSSMRWVNFIHPSQVKVDLKSWKSLSDMLGYRGWEL